MKTPNAEDYASLKSDAVFAPLPNRTLVEITGDDRISFLHNLCTNDVRQLKPGEGCEAFFTDVKGKTLLHGLLFCEEDAILLSAEPGFAESILPQLDKYLIREDVTLTDRSDAVRDIWFAGAEAVADLKKLAIHSPSEMLGHQIVNALGVDIRIRRVPFASEPCFLLQVDAAAVDQFLGSLGALEMVRVTDRIVELARLEAGYPAYGRDISAENLPQEVNRDSRAISFTKGCYLGQETVARIDALGHVNRYLVSLTFADPTGLPEVGADLMDGEKVVGKVTSASLRPGGYAIAMGYLRRESVESNAVLSTGVGEARIIRGDA